MTAFFSKLQKEASQRAPIGSKTFIINGHTCGTVVSRACEFLSNDAVLNSRFVFSENSIELRIQTQDPNVISDELREIARRLYAINAIHTWRDESLDVVDSHTGQAIAQAERSVFRFFGFTTTCVHALARDAETHWVSQRSLTKAVGPGLFDTLAGGLMSAGETPLATLIRETHEEAGIELNPETDIQTERCVRFLVTRPVNEGWMREIVFGYPVRIRQNPQNLDGEVNRFLKLSSDEVNRLIEKNRFTLDAALCLIKISEGNHEVRNL